MDNTSDFSAHRVSDPAIGESVFSFLRKFSDTELRTPGILGFNTGYMSNQLVHSIRIPGIDLESPIGSEVHQFHPSHSEFIQSLHGNLGAISLFAEVVRDKRLFHVPISAARTCAEAAASMLRPAYTSPPPLPAGALADLWPPVAHLRHSASSATTISQQLSTEGDDPVPVLLLRGSSVHTVHTPDVLVPSVMRSELGATKISMELSPGKILSHAAPRGPSASAAPEVLCVPRVSLDQIIDMTATKSDVEATLCRMPVPREGQFVLWGSQQREGGLTASYLKKDVATGSFKVHHLRIDRESDGHAGGSLYRIPNAARPAEVRPSCYKLGRLLRGVMFFSEALAPRLPLGCEWSVPKAELIALIEADPRFA